MSQQAHPRLEKRSDNLVRASLNAIVITEINETKVGETCVLCVVQEGVKVKVLQYVRSVDRKVQVAKASLLVDMLATAHASEVMCVKLTSCPRSANPVPVVSIDCCGAACTWFC